MEKNYNKEMDDELGNFVFEKDLYDGELFEFQKDIISKITNNKYNKNPIICAPTGSGKTRIAVEIMNKLKNKFLFIFVVPNIILIDSTIEELVKNSSLNYGIVQSDNTEYDVEKNDVIIISKMSSDKRIKELKTEINASSKERKLCMIFDECHLSIFRTISFIQKFKPNRWFGLSATPERYDGIALLRKSYAPSIYDNSSEFNMLSGAFDDIIDSVSIPKLISIGRLSNLRLFVKPIDEFRNMCINKAEITDEKFMDKIYTEKHIYGDVIEMYKKYGIGKATIGFCTTVKMAEKVKDAINGTLGTTFKVISYKNTDAEREELLEQLASKKISGLICADILAIGFNCPQVEYAFCLKHIKSKAFFVQIVGRVIRACEGKEAGIFVDHGDSISNFISEDNINIFAHKMKWNYEGNKLEDVLLNSIDGKTLEKELPEFKEPRNVIKEASNDYIFKSFDKIVKINEEEFDFENSTYIDSNDKSISFNEIKNKLAKFMYITGKFNNYKPSKDDTENGKYDCTNSDRASISDIIKLLNNGRLMVELTPEVEEEIKQLFKKFSKSDLIKQLKEENFNLCKTNRHLQMSTAISADALSKFQCERLFTEIKRITLEKEFTHGINKSKLRVLYKTSDDEEAYATMRINLRDLCKLYDAPIEVKVVNGKEDDLVFLSDLTWVFKSIDADLMKF